LPFSSPPPVLPGPPGGVNKGSRSSTFEWLRSRSLHLRPLRLRSRSRPRSARPEPRLHLPDRARSRGLRATVTAGPRFRCCPHHVPTISLTPWKHWCSLPMRTVHQAAETAEVADEGVMFSRPSDRDRLLSGRALRHWRREPPASRIGLLVCQIDGLGLSLACDLKQGF
jgi:hypothetical protein